MICQRPGGGPGRGGDGETSCRERRTYSLNRPARPAKSLSPRARASAEALSEFRLALNLWDRCHGQTPMPTPAQFGLRLPAIRPSEVWWRSRA